MRSVPGGPPSLPYNINKCRLGYIGIVESMNVTLLLAKADYAPGMVIKI